MPKTLTNFRNKRKRRKPAAGLLHLPTPLLCVVAFVAAWLGSGIQHSQSAEPAPESKLESSASVVGRSIPSFELKSHRGKAWSLEETDADLIVVVFTGTECPLAKLYAPRLAELFKQFGGKGVEFVGINSNTQDSGTEMTAFVSRYGVPFPMLKDAGNRVADQFQAQRTPEVFVLDRERVIRYHGRIDDQYGVGYSRHEAKNNDLSNALEDLLADKPVRVPETEVIGCLIGRVQTVEPSGDITYAKQISRILNRRCVECHRDGEIAPFTLTSYDDLLGWEDTILEVIADNRMPPWFANPAHGEFSNDSRLTEEEKRLIRQWVLNGMPEGDEADLPEPPKFTDGWKIPEPDAIVHMSDEPFQVPAEGVVDYKYFQVDPGWDEDRYVYAAEARPDNASVVHHIIVYLVPPNEPRIRGDDREMLVGYAPGATPKILKEGVAMFVPAGSKFLFEMHYTPNGSAQKDRSYAGFKFIDKEDVKELLLGRMAINTRFRIPPHDDNKIVTASYVAANDELLLSMTPHMHLRGKAFRYEAQYPNGDKEVLLDVPKYDFNWQLSYELAEPKKIPRGTRILCTAAFDNSEDNPVNPDPSRSVRWGDQSFEEMMIGFFGVIPVEENDQPLLSDASIDPSGTWEWQRNGKTEQLTLSLSDKMLSGQLKASNRTLPISFAQIQDDELSFQIVLKEFGELVLQFRAKVTDSQLEGEISYTVASVGRSQEIPWVATKKADAKSE